MKNKKLLGVLGVAALLLAGNFAMQEKEVVDAAGQPEKLYLTPNSYWLQKGHNTDPRFAAYFFGNGERWVSMTDDDGDKMFEVAVPTDKVFPSVIFCRMNGTTTANGWNNKYNQTADLTIPTNGNNHYTVKANTWDKGGGSWSKYEPAAPEKEAYEKLSETITSYYNNGVYLKETTINLTQTAVDELNQHGGFHADADDLVRVTQYNGDTLTMTIPGNNEYESNYGTDSNGNLTHWGKGGVPKAVISKPTSVETAGNWKNWTEGGMEGYYWTLKDIIPTAEHNWTEKDGVYSSTDATVIEWFKAIVAPCYVGFNTSTGNYITLSKVEIEDLGESLNLRLLASASDSTKLTNENNVFAQATISKEHNTHLYGLSVNGNHSYECVFCREHGFTLVGSINGWNTSNGQQFVAHDEDEVKITVNLTANDEIKVFRTHTNAWYGYGNLQADCKNVVSGTDNIVIKTTGTYTLYINSNDGSIWIALEQ